MSCATNIPDATNSFCDRFENPPITFHKNDVLTSETLELAKDVLLYWEIACPVQLDRYERRLNANDI